MAKSKHPRLLKAVAVAAVVFGGATIFSGGSVVFGIGEARAAAGNIVWFVVWFNFVAGFAYVAAGLGLLGGRAWAPRLCGLIALCNLIVLAGFGAHVFLGGTFETRTTAAMAFRSVFWVVAAALAFDVGRSSPAKAG